MRDTELPPELAHANVDLTTPNAARVYDYYLGGACNFAADREFAKQVIAVMPQMREIALLNRSFLRRAVRFLVRSGIRQFLDLGSGIPTVGNTHDVAHEVAPDARVVYVDYEAMAVAHSELILKRNEHATIVRADMRDTEAVLGDPETQRMLDFTEPVAVLMVAVLHFVPESDHPDEIIARYREAVAPGSHLVISHATTDDIAESSAAISMYQNTANPMTPRSRDRFRELFTGWELLDPGVVYTAQWHPESPEDVGEHPESSGLYAGVARKT